MDDVLRGQEVAAGDPYAALRAKVDAFHAQVAARHPGGLTCHAGCQSCCHRHLSVFAVEFRHMAQAVLALPDADRAALAERLAAGRADPRCPLLDDAGRCRVYAARPIICRSHGLPLQVGDPPVRDVCPLNFTPQTGAPSLEELPAEDVLAVDRLNAMLSLIERLAPPAPGAAQGEGEEPRVDLFEGLTALLASPPP